MANAETAAQLILQSISKDITSSETGETQRVYDPEQIRYQLYNIDTDNFAAFLKAHKDVLTIQKHMKETMLPSVASVVVNLIKETTENALISISGKSSENGKLLSMLLNDRQEQKITYDGLPKEENTGYLQKLREKTASNENNPTNDLVG